MEHRWEDDCPNLILERYQFCVIYTHTLYIMIILVSLPQLVKTMYNIWFWNDFFHFPLYPSIKLLYLQFYPFYFILFCCRDEKEKNRKRKTTIKKTQICGFGSILRKKLFWIVSPLFISPDQTQFLFLDMRFKFCSPFQIYGMSYLNEFLECKLEPLFLPILRK